MNIHVVKDPHTLAMGILWQKSPGRWDNGDNHAN